MAEAMARPESIAAVENFMVMNWRVVKSKDQRN